MLSLANKKSDEIVISSYAYQYDKAGNRTSVTDHNNDVESYLYDKVYRLVQVDYPDTTQVSYTYDAVGNRLTLTDSSGTTTYTYDDSNRLLSAGDITYTYDNNGNLTSKTEDGQTTTYTYDYENRLVSITTGTSTLTYTYSPTGERMSKTVDGVTTYFFYDDKNVLMEYDSSWNLKKRYTTTLKIDEIISIDQY